MARNRPQKEERKGTPVFTEEFRHNENVVGTDKTAVPVYSVGADGTRVKTGYVPVTKHEPSPKPYKEPDYNMQKKPEPAKEEKRHTIKVIVAHPEPVKEEERHTIIIKAAHKEKPETNQPRNDNVVWKVSTEQPEPEPTQNEAQKDDPTATLERRQKVKQIADRYDIREGTNHSEYLERLVLRLADELDKATAAAASLPEPLKVPEKRKTGRPQVLDAATIQQVLELRRHGVSYPLIAERISESGTQVSREMIRRICTAHGVKTPQKIRREEKEEEQ